MRKSFDRIVVIGASAGGIGSVASLLSGLPEDFPWPILVVIHVGPTSTALPSVLSRAGPLQVINPKDGQPIRPGCVYVAPSNRHMMVRDGRIELSAGPRENRVRPAIDQLFRTVARVYQSRVIGVVLSGELDDGVAGLIAIKARGGLAIVQDPNEATSPSMPKRASECVQVDHSLPVAKIATLLAKLCRRKSPANPASSSTMKRLPPGEAEMRLSGMNGEPVPVSCPQCGGPLFKVNEGKIARFHCIVGHAFSPLSLTASHADALDRAIWVATRILRERLNLQRIREARISTENHARARLAEETASIEKDLELLEQVQGRI